MRPEQIQQLLETNLTDCKAIISSKDNVHFEAKIISSAFTGKNRVQAQKLVYEILNKYILDGSIHAISLKTLTPVE